MVQHFHFPHASSGPVHVAEFPDNFSRRKKQDSERLGHVRIEGNNALYDPDDFEEDDAKPLRLFTEMFLRYVFELPGEVRAFRGEAVVEP